MKKIKNIGWTTDTHFELASKKQFDKFIESTENCDMLIITGDIAQATSWQHYLFKLAKKIHPIPIYFILGNHDIYHSELNIETNKLSYITIDNLLPLTILDPILLSDNIALIGHQNWWDGGYSLNKTNFIDRTFMFQDYSLIDDLSKFSTQEEKFAELKKMSENATTIIIEKLNNAFNTVDNVILAVHVPPYEQNCTHFGIPMTSNFLSHFSSKILGDALYYYMRNIPNKKLIVLSGHTHEKTTYTPLHNLISKTSKSNLLKPRVHEILKLKDLF
jgi:Icc-related predicted phosphoesterase